MSALAAPYAPQKVDTLRSVFPTDVSDLMPSMDDIPPAFQKLSFGRSGSSWSDFAADWFYRGMKGANWEPKPGIDVNTAVRHLKTVLGSYDPSHEHKMAAVAFLASQWFEQVDAGGKTYGGAS